VKVGNATGYVVDCDRDGVLGPRATASSFRDAGRSRRGAANCGRRTAPWHWSRPSSRRRRRPRRSRCRIRRTPDHAAGWRRLQWRRQQVAVRPVGYDASYEPDMRAHAEYIALNGGGSRMTRRRESGILGGGRGRGDRVLDRDGVIVRRRLRAAGVDAVPSTRLSERGDGALDDALPQGRLGVARARRRLDAGLRRRRRLPVPRHDRRRARVPPRGRESDAPRRPEPHAARPRDRRASHLVGEGADPVAPELTLTAVRSAAKSEPFTTGVFAARGGRPRASNSTSVRDSSPSSRDGPPASTLSRAGRGPEARARRAPAVVYAWEFTTAAAK